MTAAECDWVETVVDDHLAASGSTDLYTTSNHVSHCECVVIPSRALRSLQNSNSILNTIYVSGMTVSDLKPKNQCVCVCVLDYEYICDKTAKFLKKILFITRIINVQIMMTKYFTFQYSITYCSQALRRPAHRARETVHLLTHETPDFITPAL